MALCHPARDYSATPTPMARSRTTRYPQPPHCLQRPKKRQLVRCYGEAFVRQSTEQPPLPRVEKHVVDLLALLTNEMLVRADERITVLRAPQSQHLQFAFADELPQVTVDCP
jgi:hypothetical protein